MILESAHRSRDEQRWRAARRRIRETLALRRAAAASGQRTAAASGQGTPEPPAKPPAEPGFTA
ncbi:MAG TPA: hypothetical protein VHN18_02030 [Micromonosporaceae bacterium]|nr:hypothetical protein [Micromonosporaceae bacterium]